MHLRKLHQKSINKIGEKDPLYTYFDGLLSLAKSLYWFGDGVYPKKHDLSLNCRDVYGRISPLFYESRKMLCQENSPALHCLLNFNMQIVFSRYTQKFFIFISLFFCTFTFHLTPFKMRLSGREYSEFLLNSNLIYILIALHFMI